MTTRVPSMDHRIATGHLKEDINAVNSRNAFEVEEDTFDFANSFSGNQDRLKKINAKVKSNETEDKVAEEVPNQERLGYLFVMSKGDIDKFIAKAAERNIPEEEVDIWLQNNQAA